MKSVTCMEGVTTKKMSIKETKKNIERNVAHNFDKDYDERSGR